MTKKMQKIDADSPEAKSADLVAENIARLKALFPELVTEGENGASVNVDVLKQLVGDQTVTDADEKYGLNWFGKRKARQLALTPSLGTLRPAPEESVDWDTTQNLMIEGDNLEVLKLLQKSYAGKVKLIYIDPPYNTGKDFVYTDDFKDGIRNYKEITGQTEDGRTATSNPETSGRFHTNWLNMMYPRLKVARDLLRDDGVLFISIDDSEVINLRRLGDEIFGEENFVACLPTIMNLKGNNDEFGFAGTHEYTLAYARSIDSLEDLGGIALMPEDEAEYDMEDAKGRYKRGATLMRTGEAGAREQRPRGYYPIYVSRDLQMMSVKRQAKDDIEVYPRTRDGREMSWRRSPETLEASVAEFIIQGTPDAVSFYKKQRLDEDRIRGKKPKSLFYKPEYSSGNGTAQIKQLLGERVFSNPKPVELIIDFIRIGSPDGGVILDFFAGSGTCGHAVMAQSASDMKSRQYILVQLPETLIIKNKDQRIAAELCESLGRPHNIAEITKERLRRAGAKIKAEHPEWNGDTGFRVFKLDSSNLRAWDPDRDNLEQTLLDHAEHVKPDRTENDLLYELLLKLGLDLCVPIEKRHGTGLDSRLRGNDGLVVHSVGGGVLMACLAADIDRKDVEALAQGIVDWHKELAPVGETTCVFRDSAFPDEASKANMTAILEQAGITHVRSL